MLRRLILMLMCGFALISSSNFGLATGKDRPDERIKSVTSIFVSGNNQAAEGARRFIGENKTCFTLATKQSDADAILAINADTQTQGGVLGGFGARAWIASATLTLRSGDLVWSHSERWSDDPLRSGGKIAGKLLVNRLARESACKQRGK